MRSIDVQKVDRPVGEFVYASAKVVVRSSEKLE
jgi:hypothetical protein